jgi:hypothetical protein
MVKVPVVNRLDYTMYLEPCADMLWFHTDVRKWTPEIKKEYLKDLETLQSLVAVPLVALVSIANTKLARFARLIGFKEFNKVIFNNIEYNVFTRSK